MPFNPLWIHILEVVTLALVCIAAFTVFKQYKAHATGLRSNTDMKDKDNHLCVQAHNIHSNKKLTSSSQQTDLKSVSKRDASPTLAANSTIIFPNNSPMNTQENSPTDTPNNPSSASNPLPEKKSALNEYIVDFF